MNQKKITKIDLSKKVYGGRIYENEICNQLKNEVFFERIFILKYNSNILNFTRLIFLFVKYRYFFRGSVLLNDHTVFLAGTKTIDNFLIIHHIDSSYSPLPSKVFQKINMFFLKWNKDLFKKVIVVSKYWEKELHSIGFKKIDIIYNCFDTCKLKVGKKEKLDFKKKYFNNQKPIIYLGNSQLKKGAIDVYEKLNKFDFNFVTTGTPQVRLPVKNLKLSYREYITLLAVSDIVITMSKFREGWNRIAHEATLLNTKVIGSGLGGMMELMRLSNQIICNDIRDLPDLVIETLNNKHNIDKSHLLNFNLEYFKDKWKKTLVYEC